MSGMSRPPAAGRWLAAMPRAGPRPDPARRRARVRGWAASHRRGDDADAVRLALGLIDDRTVVVRTDEETRIGQKHAALAIRRLSDGVAQDDASDGRTGGSDALADPLDAATREPDRFHEAARLTRELARQVLEHGSTLGLTREMCRNAGSAFTPALGEPPTPEVQILQRPPANPQLKPRSSVGGPVPDSSRTRLWSTPVDRAAKEARWPTSLPRSALGESGTRTVPSISRMGEGLKPLTMQYMPSDSSQKNSGIVATTWTAPTPLDHAEHDGDARDHDQRPSDEPQHRHTSWHQARPVHQVSEDEPVRNAGEEPWPDEERPM